MEKGDKIIIRVGHPLMGYKGTLLWHHKTTNTWKVGLEAKSWQSEMIKENLLDKIDIPISN